MLVCAIDLILQDPGSSLLTDDLYTINQTTNLITSDESMVISPYTSFNISMTSPRENKISKSVSHRRHHGSVKKYRNSRRLRCGGVSTPLEELRTRDESSDSTPEETVSSITYINEAREPCTRGGSPDLSLGKRVKCSSEEPRCTRDESPDSSLEEAVQQLNSYPNWIVNPKQK